MRTSDVNKMIERAEEAFEEAKKREWVGLTDAEIMHCMSVGSYIENGRAIEAKLKEKNT